MRLTCPARPRTRLLLGLLAVPLVAYALYFAAVAIILNTPLFARLTGMREDEEHLRFSLAYSLVPGRVRAHEIFLGIREPGVDLDIRLRGPVIDLELSDLLRKQVRIHRLETRGMHVAIRMKKPPADRRRREIGEAEEMERREKRWKIWITGIDLRGFEAIELGERKLTGEMRIRGGFFLQPGTLAEIFPTTFTVREGRWNGDIRDVTLDLEAAFARFRGPRVSGSEVFDYLDAKVAATGVAESLDLLNLTLRSLDGYAFGRTEAANLAANVTIAKGVIQPGSHFRADRSEVRFDSPTLKFSGRGRVAWEVGDRPDESSLALDLRDARAAIGLSRRQTLRGSLGEVEGRARLRGLRLADPFSGLAGRIRIARGEVGIAGGDVALSARLRGGLTAIAGEVPESWIPRAASDLKIWIDRSRIALPDVGRVTGNGLIAVSVRPIDFRAREAELPALRFDYSGRIEEKYGFGFRWRAARAVRKFPRAEGKPGSFDGAGTLHLTGVDRILAFLKDTKRIPTLAAAALGASELGAAFEWSFTEDEKWIRAKEVDSDGIWKGWGAVTFSEHETRGAFEGLVAGIPVGIGLGGEDVRFKLLPNREWYDARAPMKPEP